MSNVPRLLLYLLQRLFVSSHQFGLLGGILYRHVRYQGDQATDDQVSILNAKSELRNVHWQCLRLCYCQCLLLCCVAEFTFFIHVCDACSGVGGLVVYIHVWTTCVAHVYAQVSISSVAEGHVQRSAKVRVHHTSWVCPHDEVCSVPVTPSQTLLTSAAVACQVRHCRIDGDVA